MRPPGVMVLLAVSTLKTSNRILAATVLLWWAIRGNSGGNRGAAAHCRTVAPNPCAKPHNVAMGSTLIEARMDRSASSDCSFLKKRRVERNPVRGDGDETSTQSGGCGRIPAEARAAGIG